MTVATHIQTIVLKCDVPTSIKLVIALGYKSIRSVLGKVKYINTTHATAAPHTSQIFPNNLPKPELLAVNVLIPSFHIDPSNETTDESYNENQCRAR